MPSLAPALDRMLSRSIFGTVLVLSGGTLLLVGALYGIGIGLTKLVASPPAGPTPAGNGGVLGFVGVVLLLGSAIAALGGQLLGYAR